MKALFTMAVVGVSLMGSLGLATAQPYGGGDYGYRDRGDRYRDHDDGYRDRGGYGDRGGYRERGYGGGFDEAEYLRCNPDVRRAVNNGQMESGAAHYKTFGRREGRRLSC